MKKTNNTSIKTASETKNIDELVPDYCLDDYAAETPAHRNERANSQKNALREEAGYSVIREEKRKLNINDLFAEDEKVTKKFLGIPAVGIHKVKLECDPEVFEGKNGIWVKLTLIDTKTNCFWYAFINKDSIKDALDTISVNNNGLLAAESYIKAFDVLKSKSFNCWTLQTEKGKTVTYFDETKYNNRLYVLNKFESDYELRKLREKERADNKARMAEEAKMGREEKAPWEN